MSKRCGFCGKSHPEDRTALVPGSRGGNYRRSSSRTERRVCADCVRQRVAYVRDRQSNGYNVPLDQGVCCWSKAADLLDIAREGLYRSPEEKRRWDRDVRGA